MLPAVGTPSAMEEPNVVGFHDYLRERLDEVDTLIKRVLTARNEIAVIVHAQAAATDPRVTAAVQAYELGDIGTPVSLDDVLAAARAIPQA